METEGKLHPTPSGYLGTRAGNTERNETRMDHTPMINDEEKRDKKN
jgi:hypothetical protein